MGGFEAGAGLHPLPSADDLHVTFSHRLVSSLSFLWKSSPSAGLQLDSPNSVLLGKSVNQDLDKLVVYFFLQDFVKKIPRFINFIINYYYYFELEEI